MILGSATAREDTISIEVARTSERLVLAELRELGTDSSAHHGEPHGDRPGLEKPRGDGAMINGGYFVLSPKVIDYIEDDSTTWEQEPLKKLAETNQLNIRIEDLVFLKYTLM